MRYLVTFKNYSGDESTYETFEVNAPCSELIVIYAKEMADKKHTSYGYYSDSDVVSIIRI